MQTIIGAGGAIGKPLARELKAFTSNIRLVSRNPVKENETDELFPADVNDPAQIEKAIAGSEIVYVVIGFEYKLSVWQKTWPAFMRGVIDACKKHGAKLVFFDNVYMYAPSEMTHMTESSRMQPSSKKGAVRLQLHEMIMQEVEQNKLKALIARSADFYGPENKSSGFNIMVAEKLIKGKKAQALGDISKIHSYTYTPDAAKATALLGNTPDAYNQVWHVPTTREKLTNQDWIALAAKELGITPKVQSVPRWMIKLLGLFMPVMKEFPEMLYQYELDYFFDSSKFENRFGIKATPPEEGIKKLMESLRAQQG